MRQYHVRVWVRRYRWLWLDRLLTPPILDEYYESMTEAMQAGRDTAVGSGTRVLAVMANEVDV